MKNIQIENKNNKLILTLNKSAFNEEYLLALVKRLQIENLAQKSEFNENIMDIANEIDSKWWEENGDDFLKNVKK